MSLFAIKTSSAGLGVRLGILRSLPLIIGLLSGFGLAMSLAAAESPRERLSLAANWKFRLGDDWPDALHLENSGTGTKPASERFFDTFGASQRAIHEGCGEIKLTATAESLAPATTMVNTQPSTPRPCVPGALEPQIQPKAIYS